MLESEKYPVPTSIEEKLLGTPDYPTIRNERNLPNQFRRKTFVKTKKFAVKGNGFWQRWIVNSIRVCGCVRVCVYRQVRTRVCVSSCARARLPRVYVALCAFCLVLLVQALFLSPPFQTIRSSRRCSWYFVSFLAARCLFVRSFVHFTSSSVRNLCSSAFGGRCVFVIFASGAFGTSKKTWVLFVCSSAQNSAEIGHRWWFACFCRRTINS